MQRTADPSAGNFKRCSCCGVEWRSREAFLADPDVTLIGYQAHFEELTAGFFLFNHACQTTLAVEVNVFCDLYEGPVFHERATGGPTCAGYCQHRDELRVCPAKCECAFVREILQLVRAWPKRGRAA